MRDNWILRAGIFNAVTQGFESANEFVGAEMRSRVDYSIVEKMSQIKILNILLSSQTVDTQELIRQLLSSANYNQIMSDYFSNHEVLVGQDSAAVAKALVAELAGAPVERVQEVGSVSKTAAMEALKDDLGLLIEKYNSAQKDINIIKIISGCIFALINFSAFVGSMHVNSAGPSLLALFSSGLIFPLPTMMLGTALEDRDAALQEYEQKVKEYDTLRATPTQRERLSGDPFDEQVSGSKDEQEQEGMYAEGN